MGMFPAKAVVTGSAGDRPLASDGLAGVVFVDKDTGAHSICTGDAWVDAPSGSSIDGLSSDGQTPGGALIAGGLALQGVPYDPDHPVQLSNNGDWLQASDGTWYFGSMVIGSSHQLTNGESFNVAGLLSVKAGAAVVQLYALDVTSGDVHCEAGTLIGKSVEINNPAGLGIWQHDGLGANAFTTSPAGGIGLLGATPDATHPIIANDGAGHLVLSIDTSGIIRGPGGSVPSLAVQQTDVGQTGFLGSFQDHNGATKVSIASDGEILTTDDVLAPSGTVKGKVLEIVPQSTAGAPSTGAHNAGEFYADTAGGLFYCITSGTPGVWKTVTLT